MKAAVVVRRLLLGGCPTNFQRRRFGNCPSWSPLVARLLRTPTTRIKETLSSNDYIALTSPEFPWDSFLSSLSSSSSLRARLVLEWKLERMINNHEADGNDFSHLISLSAKILDVPFSMHVFMAMEARGIEPTTTIFNFLVRGCLSSGEVLTALSLFQIMEGSEWFKPDSDTYDAFVAGFSGFGDVGRMKAWFTAKIDSGFDRNARNYEALVSGCVKAGDFDGADGFYKEMMDKGIIPTECLLECMVEGFCRRRRCDSVMEFLKFLLECGFKVNGNMVDKVVGLYTGLGRVDEMEKLIETLMLFYRDGEALVHAHCGIIRMYAALDQLDDVEYAVGRMLSQGMSFRSPSDVEKVIALYFRREAYDRLGLFLEHIREYYKLAKSTFDLLIAGYKRAGLAEKLDSVMEDMKLAQV